MASGPCQPSAGYRISRVQSAGRLRRAALEPNELGEWRIWPTTAARQLLDHARNRSIWMTVYLAQVDLANPAARLAHVVEPQTSGCDRRTDSRMEISWAKNERGANYPVVMAPPSQELEPPINPGRFTALSAIRLPSLEGSPGLRRGQPHSNCLVVHYQNEQPNYQQRKENNDDDRNNGIPASGRLAIGRFGSGFLRRSDTQQEAHLIPRRSLRQLNHPSIKQSA